MIYTWRCEACKETVEVERPVAEYLVGPEEVQTKKCKRHNWKRIIPTPPSVPFEHLKNAGILPNQYGDIAPRKMD